MHIRSVALYIESIGLVSLIYTNRCYIYVPSNEHWLYIASSHAENKHTHMKGREWMPFIIRMLKVHRVAD